ncbi:MAG: hypothetical protein QGG40_04820 [Myxococcota bacterium]|nr:hypothetical protein [Myxococcota bacterium]
MPANQVKAVLEDYRTAGLPVKLQGLLDFCVKLTRHPGDMNQADVTALKNLGYDDDQVSSAVMVASYFNFINRVADGLGIDPSPDTQGHPPLCPAPW